MEEINHNIEMHQCHSDFILWFGQCLLHVVVTSFGQGLQSTSQVIQRSNLSATVFFLISSFLFVRNLHKLESLTLTQLYQVNHKSKGEVESNTQDRLVATHAQKLREESTKTAQRCYSSNHVLRSLSTKAKA
jgi:hypothetical protein